MMTVSEVARKLGVSEGCIRVMADRGELGMTGRTRRGMRLFSAETVEAYLKSRPDRTGA